MRAAGVRALGAARRSLRAQMIQSGAYLVGGVGGAFLGGARGTCIGVAMATGFGAVAYWFQLVALAQSMAPSCGRFSAMVGSAVTRSWAVSAGSVPPESAAAPRGTPPSVTVALPVYNGERYLEEALEGLLA